MKKSTLIVCSVIFFKLRFHTVAKKCSKLGCNYLKMNESACLKNYIWKTSFGMCISCIHHIVSMIRKQIVIIDSSVILRRPGPRGPGAFKICKFHKFTFDTLIHKFTFDVFFCHKFTFDTFNFWRHFLDELGLSSAISSRCREIPQIKFSHFPIYLKKG